MTAFLMIFRRLPKTFEEDPKMFRWYTNEFKHSLRDKLDLSEIIDIFSSEDIITSHVKTSYRFYQFVTTRYTTDFYNKYMLFAGWEVRIVKNCDRGLANAAAEGSIFKSEVTVFHYTDRP